jgi:hypothetical protein
MSKRVGLAAMLMAAGCGGCMHHTPPATPGAAAVVAPAPAQNFIVFFPGETTDITAEGKSVVSEIVATAKSANPKRVTVMGEDDGGTSHDATVASERGKNVANALVESGLDAATVVQVPAVPPPQATGIVAHKVVVNFES